MTWMAGSGTVHGTSVRGWSLMACLVVFSLCATATRCWAAPEEIQVYLDDKEEPGNYSIDWHNNYVWSGRSSPQYAGERPPEGVYRLTPEFNLGLTKTLEFGSYLLSSRTSDGDVMFDGVKVRLKYIAPHEEVGLYWGANLEVGKEDRASAPQPWNAELKAIIGWRGGPWTIGWNLNADTSLESRAGPVVADLDMKMSYTLTPKTALGIESYNDLGPFSHPQPINVGSKVVYAVIDTAIAGMDLNAGIGRGLTHDSDQWTLKFILTTRFH
jgi:hypothetical protein